MVSRVEGWSAGLWACTGQSLGMPQGGPSGHGTPGRRGMAWLPRGRLRWVIAGGLVVALVVVGVIIAWPHAKRYTGVAPPAQFYEKVQLQPALASDYPRVLGVAHNAGNNLETLTKALRYGADVIEIDVISARGQLVAGRNQPLPRLARRVFRGPTLAESWD